MNEGWALWAVFRRSGPSARREAPAGLEHVIGEIQKREVSLRGIYDVSGLRADADLLFWLHGDNPAALQDALRRIRRSTEIAPLEPTWSALGVHRDAEFSRSHVPGFLRGERPRDWLAVYPFVRAYDWYLLPASERGTMLAEHGRKGSAFTSVVANTVAAFALGDYEWILPMESDSLIDLVDMMRELRATEARLHVQEEVPFFTGRRILVDDIPEVLA